MHSNYDYLKIGNTFARSFASGLPGEHAYTGYPYGCEASLECTKVNLLTGIKAQVEILSDSLIRIRARKDDRAKLIESSINVVRRNNLKRLNGLSLPVSESRQGTGISPRGWLIANAVPPAERRSLNHHQSIHARQGKPDLSPPLSGGKENRKAT